MKKFTIKLPYYVHLLMNQYIAGEREIAKKNRIIFYGQDDLKYDQYYIKEYFKKVSRKKVFEFIRDSTIDFVSPDDFFNEHIFETIVSAFNDHPGVDMVIGDVVEDIN